MMHFTLFKPGEDLADRSKGAVNIDYAGGGMVLLAVGADTPQPRYFENSQEAKEFMITYAADLIEIGYRVHTGEGVAE